MFGVMRRIDEFLLVKELNAQLLGNVPIPVELLCTAVTPTSAKMAYSYERLEILGTLWSLSLLAPINGNPGDAVLKSLASLYLYVLFPNDAEGVLHLKRQSIISNKALLRSALIAGLPPFIQSAREHGKSWLPPNVFVDTDVRSLCADACILTPMLGARGREKTKTSR